MGLLLLPQPQWVCHEGESVKLVPLDVTRARHRVFRDVDARPPLESGEETGETQFYPPDGRGVQWGLQRRLQSRPLTLRSSLIYSDIYWVALALDPPVGTWMDGTPGLDYLRRLTVPP